MPRGLPSQGRASRLGPQGVGVMGQGACRRRGMALRLGYHPKLGPQTGVLQHRRVRAAARLQQVGRRGQRQPVLQVGKLRRSRRLATGGLPRRFRSARLQAAMLQCEPMQEPKLAKDVM